MQFSKEFKLQIKEKSIEFMSQLKKKEEKLSYKMFKFKTHN